MIKKIFYATHRILGVVTCLLFLMWFITGLVLIYHPFPDVDKSLKNKLADNISQAILPIDSLPIPNGISKLTLNQQNQEAVFTIKDKKQLSKIVATDPNQFPKSIDVNELNHIARKWSNGPILKIDTLEKRDIWIMYNKYVDELPIYKIHFDDAEQHQLYISSRNGEIQQFTTKSERVWGYVGSIPHKLYIPALRQNTELWIDTLTTLATLCLIACITGLVLGIRAYIVRYKRTKTFSSPYKKKVYKLHNIIGLVFGIFLLTWAISGMMALRKTPQWLVKTHQSYPYTKVMQGNPIQLEDFKLDYRTVLKSHSNVKEISWNYFYNHPYYQVTTDEGVISIDAMQTSEINPYVIDPEVLSEAIKKIHGDSVSFEANIINEYEEYYLPWTRSLPLPAYKVTVDTPDKNRYYIATDGSKITHIDKNRKARKWLFKGFHYLHFQFLMERPILWTISIWTLSLGCITICGTGLVLSIKYLKRKFRKKKKLNKEICQSEK